MKCLKCGEPLNGALFCTRCGTKYEGDETVAKPLEIMENNEGKVKQKSKKWDNKVLVIGGAIIGILAIVALGVGVSSGKNSRQELMLYRNKSDDIYMANKKGEFEKIAKENNFYLYDETLQHYYFLDQEGELSYASRGKDETRLSQDVQEFGISQSGKSVLYIEDFDYEKQEGILKYQVLGKDAVVITKKCGPVAMMSPNGKYVLYGEKNKDDMMTVYLSKNSKKGVEVLDDVQKLFGVSDTGQALLCDDRGTLILIEANGKATDIVKDITYAAVSKDFERIVAHTKDGEMGMYKQSKWKELEEVDNFEQWIQSVQLEGDKEYFLYRHEDGTDLILGNDTVITLKRCFDMPIFTEDKEVIYYKNDKNNLYRVQLKNGKSAMEEKIASDVKQVEVIPQSKDLAYIDEDGDAYYYKFKKESKKVARDVQDLVITEKGKIYYIDDENVLYMLDKKDQKVELMEDVEKCVLGVNDRVYAIDQHKTLFEIIGTNKVEKRGKNVNWIYSIGNREEKWSASRRGYVYVY